MPTPKGKGLAGRADAREPGWEERTKARVNASEVEQMAKSRRKRDVQMRVDWDIEMQTLLRLAAEGRGIPVTAYVRRSVAAFVAHDLELPFEEVCGFFARPYFPGGALKPGEKQQETGKTIDDGQGFGAWKVC